MSERALKLKKQTCVASAHCRKFPLGMRVFLQKEAKYPRRPSNWRQPFPAPELVARNFMDMRYLRQISPPHSHPHPHTPLISPKAGWQRFGLVQLRFVHGAVRAARVFGSDSSYEESLFLYHRHSLTDMSASGFVSESGSNNSSSTRRVVGVREQRGSQGSNAIHRRIQLSRKTRKHG